MAQKPKAFPKSMGACADLLHDLRTERLRLDKLAEAAKAEENRLTEHIINNLPKGDTGAAGKHHQVAVKTKQVPQIDAENIQKLFGYIKKHDAFDLFQRRLNETAVMDRVAAQKPKRVKDPATGEVTEVYAPLPGTKFFTTVKVSLTKVGSR